MAETLLDKSLSKIHILLRLSGTNIAIGEAAPTNTKKNRCIYSLNFIIQNIDVLGAVCWFISGLTSGKSFTELTYSAPCIVISYLSVIKSMSIIIYEKKVYQLTENSRMMEANEMNREKTIERTKIIEKGINFLNLILDGLYFFNTLLLVCFALHPLILMTVNYKKTNELELLLPFLVMYPFDAYNIKVWPMVYARQIWTGTVTILNISVTDFLFYTICSHITIKFRLLQYDIEHLITGTQKSIYNDEMCGGRIRNKLVEIIKWHQELITCVNLLEIIYSVSMLYNFVSSSIIICLTGFNMTENNDIILIISFFSFLLMGLLQIFFLCFFGDMLMDAVSPGSAVQSEIDDCRRIYVDVKPGTRNTYVGRHYDGFKTLCTVVEVMDLFYHQQKYDDSYRYPSMISESDDGYFAMKKSLGAESSAQNPCKLTAYGFADVSLRAFMKVLSTSWFYFALLKTLYRSE